jgi:endonuclease YncB( thermonuclease family)
MGLEIDPHHRTYLAAYLVSQHPTRQVRCVPQIRWARNSYALPDTVIGPGAATGRVVGVSDGDTIPLLTAANQQHRIRIAGIDGREPAHGCQVILTPTLPEFL